MTYSGKPPFGAFINYPLVAVMRRVLFVPARASVPVWAQNLSVAM